MFVLEVQTEYQLANRWLFAFVLFDYHRVKLALEVG